MCWIIGAVSSFEHPALTDRPANSNGFITSALYSLLITHYSLLSMSPIVRFFGYVVTDIQVRRFYPFAFLVEAFNSCSGEAGG